MHVVMQEEVTALAQPIFEGCEVDLELKVGDVSFMVKGLLSEPHLPVQLANEPDQKLCGRFICHGMILRINLY